jgi:hypothetical protein
VLPVLPPERPLLPPKFYPSLGDYRFNAIAIKISMIFFTETIWTHKRSQIAKEILNKKSNASNYTTKP